MVPYEILFGNGCLVKPMPDDGSIPLQDTFLTTLSVAFEVRPNSVLDVLVIPSEVSEPSNVALRSGGVKKMLRARLWDSSECPIDIVAWGDKAEEFHIRPFEIYLLKGVKVKEFKRDRNLLVEDFTELLEPFECKELRILREWKENNLSRIQHFSEDYASSGAEAASLPEDCFRSLHHVLLDSQSFFSKIENIGKKRFYNTIAYLATSSKKISYLSCGIGNCKKKVNESNGAFYCERCQSIIEDPQYRFMADLELVDSHEKLYGRIFGNENCSAIFGNNVEELEALQSVDEELFEEKLKTNYFRDFCVRLMARKDFFEGEEKVGFEITKMVPFDLCTPSIVAKASRHLASLIDNS